jgi:hypothetical protein
MRDAIERMRLERRLALLLAAATFLVLAALQALTADSAPSAVEANLPVSVAPKETP